MQLYKTSIFLAILSIQIITNAYDNFNDLKENYTYYKKVESVYIEQMKYGSSDCLANAYPYSKKKIDCIYKLCSGLENSLRLKKATQNQIYFIQISLEEIFSLYNSFERMDSRIRRISGVVDKNVQKILELYEESCLEIKQFKNYIYHEYNVKL